jgi:DNA polymerase-3 subunit beta
MKVTIEKSKLANALKLVAKAKTKSSAIPILEEYLIQVKENYVTVIAGDLETFVEVDIFQENKETFAFLLSEQQVKLIDKLGDVIEFEYSDQVLTMTCGKDLSKSCPDSTKDYPLIDDKFGSTSISVNDTKLFVANFTKAKKFVSNDDLRPAMMGINIAVVDNAMEICATNGHYLYTAKFDVLGDNLKAICRSPIATILGSIKDINTLFISTNSRYVFFDINGMNGMIRIKSRIIDERYPDYHNVIPVNKNTTTINKKELLTTLDKAKLFANKASNQVAFIVNGQELGILTEDMDLGHEYNSTIGAVNSGYEAEHRFGVNGKYLTEIVKEMETETVTMKTSNPNRAITFEEGNEMFIIMPVMLNSYN